MQGELYEGVYPSEVDGEIRIVWIYLDNFSGRAQSTKQSSASETEQVEDRIIVHSIFVIFQLACSGNSGNLVDCDSLVISVVQFLAPCRRMVV